MKVSTLGELRDQVEDLIEEYGEDTEVRMVTQKSWPLAYWLRQLTALPKEKQQLTKGERRLMSTGKIQEDLDGWPHIVWLVTSEGTCDDDPYGPKEAWD